MYISLDIMFFFAWSFHFSFSVQIKSFSYLSKFIFIISIFFLFWFILFILFSLFLCKSKEFPISKCSLIYAQFLYILHFPRIAQWFARNKSPHPKANRCLQTVVNGFAPRVAYSWGSLRIGGPSKKHPYGPLIYRKFSAHCSWPLAIGMGVCGPQPSREGIGGVAIQRMLQTISVCYKLINQQWHHIFYKFFLQQQKNTNANATGNSCFVVKCSQVSEAKITNTNT